MWKYRCKTHLSAIGIGFLIGLLLAGLFYALPIDLSLYKEMMTEEMITFIQNNPVLMIISGAFTGAGFANVIMITQYMMTFSSLVPIIMLALVFLFPTELLTLGTLLVIPTVAVCTYGLISLNNQIKKNMQEAGLTSQADILERYKLRHELYEDVYPKAEECYKNKRQATMIYAFGIAAITFILMIINNILLLTLVVVLYFFAFNFLLRYRATCMIPITGIMYDDCDPERCASALFYLAQKGRKFKISDHILMAQCMIYMDEPELAKASLIWLPLKDASSALNYWSTKAYADYLLKDEAALAKDKEEASKVRMNFGPTGVMIQNAEIQSIDNKVSLMNGDFYTAKRYYLAAMQRTKFKFQLVDASYYIALLSFVEEDYTLATMYFEKVLKYGNRMSYVEKAKRYMEKIQAMGVQEQEQENTETVNEDS